VKDQSRFSETFKASTITPSAIFASNFNEGLTSLQEAKKASLKRKVTKTATVHADKIKILVNERKQKVSKIFELEK